MRDNFDFLFGFAACGLLVLLVMIFSPKEKCKIGEVKNIECSFEEKKEITSAGIYNISYPKIKDKETLEAQSWVGYLDQGDIVSCFIEKHGHKTQL